MGSRIPDPAPGELRADVEELLPLIARPGGMPASTMVVLARSPDLLAPFLGWAAALALNGVLSNRDHELLALRAAHNCGSKFEWEEHAEYAHDAGLTEAEIAAVAGGLPRAVGRRRSRRCCRRRTICTRPALLPTRRGRCCRATTTNPRWPRSSSWSASTQCSRWWRTRPGSTLRPRLWSRGVHYEAPAAPCGRRYERPS